MAPNPRSGAWIPGNGFYKSLDLIKKVDAESWTFVFVVHRRIVQFTLSKPMKGDACHLPIFARALRKTLLAVRASSAEFQAPSRRSASCAQRTSFSSSDKFSRLSSSLPANRARSLGISLRAAASTSLMLMTKIVPPDAEDSRKAMCFSRRVMKISARRRMLEFRPCPLRVQR
jgi:hypothetical protein